MKSETETLTKHITGAPLHPSQREIARQIIQSRKKFHVVLSPRQFGKTHLAIQLLLYYAFNDPGCKIMFTEPVYSQISKVYKEILYGIKHLNVIDSINSADHSIILKNRTIIYFKSLHVSENVRGYSINYLFVDEAAMCKNKAFEEDLLSVVNALGKKIILFSTPKGKNYFYKWFKTGQKEGGNIRSYVGDPKTSPFYSEEYLQALKPTLPWNVFRQEWLGEFIEDGGEVFSNVQNAMTVSEWEVPKAGESYFAGIDLGQKNDFTVLTILNSKGQVAYIHRENMKEWTALMNNLAVHINRYKCKKVLIEQQGPGGPVYDFLKTKVNNLESWSTDGKSKPRIINNLTVAFEQSKIKIPTKKLFDVLEMELDDYAYIYNPKTGNVKYGGRNLHDDCVMSLAIAWECFTSGSKLGVYHIY